MAKHKHILKLCSDQHSPVISGFVGDELVRTPNLDNLAQNGVVFGNHYCNNPVCTPGRYSMLTGRLPRELGTLYFSDILPLETQTYMRYFSQHGYMTTCVGKMHFHGPEQMYGWKFRPYGDMEVFDADYITGYSEEKDVVGGIDKASAKRKIKVEEYGGYNAYMLKTARRGDNEFMLFDKSVTKEAVLHLKNYFLSILDQKYQGTRPLLFEVSWKTPHCPFVGLPKLFDYYRERVSLPGKRIDKEYLATLPLSIQKRHSIDQPGEITEDQILDARAAYYALVEFTDMQIGIVMSALKELDMMDDFYIMYTSDHGEMAGEHGLWQKTCFYEESARIPMILAGPDIPKGKRVYHNTSHIDVFPTLCELAGLPEAENIRGKSMIPLINSNEKQGNIIFSELYSGNGNTQKNSFMAKYQNIKYVDYCDGTSQLFDLDKDRDELINLTDEPEYKNIKKKLQDALVNLPEPWRANDPDWNFIARVST